MLYGLNPTVGVKQQTLIHGLATKGNVTRVHESTQRQITLLFVFVLHSNDTVLTARLSRKFLHAGYAMRFLPRHRVYVYMYWQLELRLGSVGNEMHFNTGN